MSTHGAPRRSGGTYYAASYRAPGSPAPSPQAAGAERSSQAAGAPVFPPIPPPGPDPALYEEPRRPGPGPVPSPRPGFAPPGAYGPDGFPPVDPSGFGPGAAPGTGYAVPGSGGDTAVTTPRRRANRGLPIVIGALAVVLVLCIGGGAAAYFFFLAEEAPTDGTDRPVAVASASADASAAGSAETTTEPSSGRPAGGEEAVSGDLSGYQPGDCLTVDEADDNRVDEARCTDPGVYKVLLRRNGTLDDSVCDATGATFSLSQDGPGPTRDFVLCMGPVD